MISDSLIAEDTHSEFIAELLRKYNPGSLPESIFYQVARLVMLPVVEIIPILGWTNQVLLTPRSDSDPFWPGLFHIPGTVLRATDSSVHSGINRILIDELFFNQEMVLKSVPIFAFDLINTTKRGSEFSHVYIVGIDHIPQDYTAFSIDNLPENMIEHHKSMITSLRYRIVRGV